MQNIEKKQLQLHKEAVVDVAIVGAGAAGLCAAIWAGKKIGKQAVQIAVLDSARKLGAKILVAGGGRCNVTHCQVTEHDFAGSSPAAIRKVLRRFSVKQTVQFFADAGVELKQEETGKLFPVSDSARTILKALLDQVQSVDAFIAHPARVTDIDQLPCNGITKGRDKEPRLRVVSEEGVLLARHVIVCTGGKSLPKSGSDGKWLSTGRKTRTYNHQAISPCFGSTDFGRQALDKRFIRCNRSCGSHTFKSIRKTDLYLLRQYVVYASWSFRTIYSRYQPSLAN